MSQKSLPRSVLYAISARIGGIGLDLVALETIRGIQPYLGKAISYGVRAPDIDRRKMKTLRFHPVRLLSNLQSKYYYAAKKRAVARVAAQFLRTGRFDLFHVWSGEALAGIRISRSDSGRVRESSRNVSRTRISRREAVQHAAGSGHQPVSARRRADVISSRFCRCADQAKGSAHAGRGMEAAKAQGCRALAGW